MKWQIKGISILIVVVLISIFTGLHLLQAREKTSLIPFHLQQKSKAPLSVAQLNSEVEAKLFAMTNEQRIHHGLGTLLEDSVLKKVAAAHSQDMLRRSYLSHVSPEGKLPIDRVKATTSIRYLSLGENLHTIKSANGLSDSDAIAKQMMEDWLNSEPHRKNILSKKFTLLGNACASNGKAIYCTQLFGKK